MKKVLIDIGITHQVLQNLNTLKNFALPALELIFIIIFSILKS